PPGGGGGPPPAPPPDFPGPGGAGLPGLPIGVPALVRTRVSTRKKVRLYRHHADAQSYSATDLSSQSARH
ncbi:hypothetical protein KCA24_36490, partial [Escherichia coli]|nr:hypothetical protein [Escherichia coli]